MAKAGDILKSMFSQLDLAAAERYAGFFSSWTMIVGSDLASHCRLIDIKNGCLIVESDHPGWMQKFQMRQEQVLAEIKKKHPALGIRSLHYRLVREGMWSRNPVGGPAVGSGAAAREGTASDSAGRSGGQVDLSEVDVESMGDETLRGALRRLRGNLARER